MKSIFWVSCSVIALFLFGCMKVTGSSTTFGGDNVLRDEIIQSIEKIEKNRYGCEKINSLHSTPIKTEETESPEHYLLVVDELWRVEACENTHDYFLNVRMNELGETPYKLTPKNTTK